MDLSEPEIMEMAAITGMVLVFTKKPQILHVAAKGYVATKPEQFWSAFTKMPLAKTWFCGLLFLLCLSWSFTCSDICDSADTNEERQVFSFV